VPGFLASVPRAAPRCSARAGRLPAVARTLVAVAAPMLAAAGPLPQAHFAVSGAVDTSDGALDVTVVLRNEGDVPASDVTVLGELLGHRQESRVPESVAGGAEGRALLRFPLEEQRPGLHALALRLDFTQPAGATSQRAYLLLALGTHDPPPPAVRLSVPDLELLDQGALEVGVESADGASHRVRLRVLTPRGLRAERSDGALEVPAAGRVSRPVTVYRGEAPRGQRQGVLVVAEAEGDVARDAVATAGVDVAPDPALMPRLRVPLLALAAALLLAAVLAEYRRQRRP
jgi:hypothetical protein